MSSPLSTHNLRFSLEKARQSDQGVKEIQGLLDSEKTLYSLRQMFRSFFSNISILLMLLVNCLFVVALFFAPLSLNRVIVEAALFVAVLLSNMWLFYLQDKHLYLAGVSRIERRLKLLVVKGIDLRMTERCYSLVQSIIAKFRNPPLTPLQRIKHYLRKAGVLVAFISLLVSIISVTARIVVFPTLQSDWVSLYLLRNAYLLIPILPWCSRLVMKLALAIQNAKLLTVYQLEVLHTNRSLSIASPRAGEFSPAGEKEEETQEQHFQLIINRKLPNRLLFSYLSKLFFYTESSLPQNSMFDVLGDATCLCAFDKKLFTEETAFVQRVLVFHQDAATVLSLSKHPHVGVEFDHSAQLTEHLASLKPLGLNCMLGLVEGSPTDLDESLKHLGKVIGFKESITESFIPRLHIVLKDKNTNDSMFSAIVQAQATGGLQFFSRGSLRAVLRHCTDYWDGTGIKPLTSDVKSKIMEAYKIWLEADIEPIAFSYKNISQKHTKLFEEGQAVQKINKIRGRQIFIGMAGLRVAPRPGGKEIMSQLDKCYIRFVLLSADGEKQTKVFGGQLGLETDWNCIISLHDPSAPPSPPKGIQKLPIGISAITKHIEEVDNVPLLIRLYCDADAASRTQLVDIFHEYGEQVLGVGYDNKTSDFDAMLSTDLMVGVSKEIGVPIIEEDDAVAGERGSENWTTLQLHTLADTFEANLTQLLCTFTLGPSFYETFLRLIKFSRYLLNNTVQLIWFVFATTFGLHIHQALTTIFFIPATLTGIQLLWIGFLIIPIIGISLLASPIPPHLLSLISDKNLPIRARKIVRISFYVVIRTALSAVVALIVFAITLMHVWPGADLLIILGFAAPAEGQFSTNEYMQAVNFAQNVNMFALVLYIICSSIGSHHRVYSVYRHNPFRNWQWIVACLAVAAMQVCFFVVSVKETLGFLALLPWYLYVIMFCWPIVQYSIDEITKNHDKGHYQRKQDILKLEFETKLGMHSPI